VTELLATVLKRLIEGGGQYRNDDEAVPLSRLVRRMIVRTVAPANTGNPARSTIRSMLAF
jgi:hypothetical protein